MKVILLENVGGLGRAGDIKTVKDGFARNYLVPQKLVELATNKKELVLNRMKEALSKKAKKIFDDAIGMKSKLEGEKVTIHSKVGEEGKLFGSVTNADIAAALTALGYEIDKKKILIDHIKSAGEHTARVRLDEGVIAEIKVEVVGE